MSYNSGRESAFKPDIWTNITTADEAEIWRQIRYLEDHRDEELVRERLQRRYTEAYTRGTIHPQWEPVWSYFLDHMASALNLPPAVTGPDRWQGYVLGALPALRQIWRIATGAGYCFGLVTLRGGEAGVDPVWPSSVILESDPLRPNDWAGITAATIRTSEDSYLRYELLPSGRWSQTVGIREQQTPPQPEQATLPALPLFACYRTAHWRLQPRPDNTLVETHLGHAFRLSVIDHKLIYKAMQTWKSTSGSGLPQDPESQAASDVQLLLQEGERVGVLESGYDAEKELAYSTERLRMAALLRDLPPELFDSTRDRAETGAAREAAFIPLEGIQERGRAACNQWLAGLIFTLRPLFQELSLMTQSDAVSVAAVPPSKPLPTDRAQYAAGVRAMMSLGLTSPIQELMTMYGLSVGQAKARYKELISQTKRPNNESIMEVGQGPIETRGTDPA